jgi:biopolymer transport protein ExbB
MELARQYSDIIIFALLGLMAFIALWITIERLLFYKGIKLNKYENNDLLNLELTKNLTTLSIVGANAPFVGLLGTVIGVLITFYDVGQNQAINTGAIMTGLALALKATAAGIAIAIPSIMAYNGLMRKVDEISTHHQANLKPSKPD